MCGIVGLQGDGARQRDIVQAMTDRLAHRGPDDEGIWRDPEVALALGHRRLSIVELSSAGHEPMLSASGRLVITYNGEIYNHADIRRELDGLGLTPPGGWRGHSDVETFLEAVEHWGLEQALNRAVGMFAFGIWDRKDRVLRLVRDRFGEKPLYYGWAGRDFVFASELKSLVAHPDFDRTVDREALADYFARLYVPAPRSIYHGIYKLQPGGILTIATGARPDGSSQPPAFGASSGAVRIDRYWDYEAVARTGLVDPFASLEEALEAVGNGLRESVRIQSFADVPVGIFLSGGIDSALITAHFQALSAAPIRSFTIGFEVEKLNEAPQARAIARRLGTVHHEQIVTANEAMAVIPALPDIFDEPFADSSQIPTYLVSKMTREMVKVALSGDGGDELFGGYNRHRMVPRLSRGIEAIPRPLGKAIGGLMSRVPPQAWSALGNLVGQRSPDFGSKVRRGWLLASRARGLSDVLDAFLDEWSFDRSPIIGARPRQPIELALQGLAPPARQIMAHDVATYLPDDILTKVDRASMAASLETRAPFLDHRLAAIAARVPVSMNISRGSGKNVLRQLLRQRLPASLVDRPKAGFGVPIAAWLRGPLRDWAEDLLSPQALAQSGLLDVEHIRKRWEAQKSGHDAPSQSLWAILMFQSWHRRWS